MPTCNTGAKTHHHALLISIMSRRWCPLYLYELIDFNNQIAVMRSLSRYGVSNQFPGQNQERTPRSYCSHSFA